MKAQAPFREAGGGGGKLAPVMLKELFMYCDLFMGMLESSLKGGVRV